MKVLLAVDETKGSKSVLKVFRSLVKSLDGVVLVHVEQIEGKSMMTAMLGDAEMKTLRESIQGTEHKEALDRKAQMVIGYYKKELEDGGTSVKALIREGNPSEEILRVAEEEAVELIIMGCNGKRGINRLITGCATKDVERNSKVPVLVAKTAGCEEAMGWREAYVQ